MVQKERHKMTQEIVFDMVRPELGKFESLAGGRLQLLYAWHPENIHLSSLHTIHRTKKHILSMLVL